MITRLKSFFAKNREAMNTKTAQVGGYSFLLCLIVLGILIAVNVFVNLLPERFTQFDISSQKLYSITSDTKVVVNNLQDDVDVYWICQSGSEDSVVEKLLNVYDELSDHLTVTKKDPDVYPTFAQQYTDDNVTNNSIVVVCGDKYRYIDYNDIYVADTASYYTTGTASYSFDGEGAITTAISYVTSDDLPKLYIVTGHGEADLSDSFTSSLERDNYETDTLTLPSIDEIPEDADGLLINSPTSDYSDEEVKMLTDYVAAGGHLIVFSGPQDGTELTNLDSILTDYGVSTNEGIVVEADRNHYAFQQPYILLPDLGSSDITEPLTEDNRYVIAPVAQGLTVDGSSIDYTVTSLLTTSEESFSKVAGYNLTSYDKEDGDIDGPFTLAISVESNDTDGKVVWVGTDYMLDETYNSYSSGSNTDFVMNSLSWMIGQSDAISIRTKSLDYSYLTISDSVSGMLKVWMIFIIPVAYLALGITEVIARRKKQ